MRKLAILAALLIAGCDEATIDLGLAPPTVVDHPRMAYPSHEAEYPAVNLEQVLRQENWLGSEQEGSCVYASIISLLRWQGRDDLADFVRHNYGNGEYPEGLAEKLTKAGIRFAYTSQQRDVNFLEWCIRTRRGCGVTVLGGAHMVTLVHLDATQAGLLDNNNPNTIKWVSRDAFLAEWFNSRSWGVTVVYTPPAPRPAS